MKRLSQRLLDKMPTSRARFAAPFDDVKHLPASWKGDGNLVDHGSSNEPYDLKAARHRIHTRTERRRYGCL